MSIFDWKTYYKQITGGVGAIAKISPDIVKGYQVMGGAARRRICWATRSMS